jgi:hypothetical protein
MARASGRTKKHQRKQTRAARANAHRPAGRKTRTPTTAPLNAQRDATRKGQIQRKPRGNSEQVRHSTTMPLPAGHELIELMDRRTKAVLDLPVRIARCRTPFDLWREHTQFMQAFTTDCQLAAFLLMKAGLHFNHLGRIAGST